MFRETGSWYKQPAHTMCIEPWSHVQQNAINSVHRFAMGTGHSLITQRALKRTTAGTIVAFSNMQIGPIHCQNNGPHNTILVSVCRRKQDARMAATHHFLVAQTQWCVGGDEIGSNENSFPIDYDYLDVARSSMRALRFPAKECVGASYWSSRRRDVVLSCYTEFANK